MSPHLYQEMRHIKSNFSVLIGEIEHRIYLVTPSELKMENDNYADADNVISFEEFFQFHLDPAVLRWRNKKVI